MELLKFRRGRHLYSTGRPSRWASAHILVDLYFTGLFHVLINLVTLFYYIAELIVLFYPYICRKLKKLANMHERLSLQTKT